MLNSLNLFQWRNYICMAWGWVILSNCSFLGELFLKLMTKTIQQTKSHEPKKKKKKKNSPLESFSLHLHRCMTNRDSSCHSPVISHIHPFHSQPWNPKQDRRGVLVSHWDSFSQRRVNQGQITISSGHYRQPIVHLCLASIVWKHSMLNTRCHSTPASHYRTIAPVAHGASERHWHEWMCFNCEVKEKVVFSERGVCKVYKPCRGCFVGTDRQRLSCLPVFGGLLMWIVREFAKLQTLLMLGTLIVVLLIYVKGFCDQQNKL